MVEVLTKDVPFQMKLPKAKGSFGTVWIITKNGSKKVLKKFPKTPTEIMDLHPEYIEYLEYLQSINPGIIAVPDTVYQDEEKVLKGYEYDYVPGKAIRFTLGTQTVDKAYGLISTFEDEISKLEGKVDLHDAHDENILLSRNKLMLIDTDLFRASFEDDVLGEMFDFKSNISEINRTLYYAIFGKEAIAAIQSDESLASLENIVLEGKVSVNKMIREYQEYIKNYLGEDITTLGQIAGKTLKLSEQRNSLYGRLY